MSNLWYKVKDAAAMTGIVALCMVPVTAAIAYLILYGYIIYLIILALQKYIGG